MKDPDQQEAGVRAIGVQPNRLILGAISDSALPTLYALRDYVSRWRFYSSFAISGEAIRRPNLVEQEPVLNEDASNLSSVLHYLASEHRPVFEEIEDHIRLFIPEFKSLKVKARGAPGEVIAFWEEEGSGNELTVSDLSDGILRLLCWTVLCLQPNPPPLICIDEPDQGVHPRTLPVLAGLFEKACDRTQIILATHASYFLTQFDISRIAVMKKEDGQAVFAKPATSRVLTESLKDFGTEEIEILHRSDELERLA
jgi:predicted ATPase